MARPLAIDSLSLTGGGAALVTDAAGSIDPRAVAGLFVEDVRILSRWHLDTEAPFQLVGRSRTGPSSDRLLSTISSPGTIDPIATLERARTVDATGLTETIRIVAYSAPVQCVIRLTAARDDQAVFVVGDGRDEAESGSTIADGPVAGRFIVPGPEGGAAVTILADDWMLADGQLQATVDVGRGGTWETEVVVSADLVAATTHPAPTTTVVDASPGDLAVTVATGQADLRALTMAVDGRHVLAAGSPFFLALFGRDSLIAGIQALVGTPGRLTDTLAVLADYQATSVDGSTRAEPGRILHELRLGRAGVFGVAPRTPYYGAVDTAALFVMALGEALRWGASRDAIADVEPAARAALDWCDRFGDVDGDGFIESVPHASGLTNLGWKDSDDSIVDRDGTIIVGSVALAEVQAYWYRALRTMVEIEQHLGIGDGAAYRTAADALAARFTDAFVYPSAEGPYVGLALDPDKRLLDVRASNAGHVLWSGILDPDLGAAVAGQLVAPDLFSGWGLRTLSRDSPAYNPFGYHRGSVWPHDTGIALHGAARYGASSAVVTLAGGLTALGSALHGELPELISGLARGDVGLPIPYPAACRPQAWAAGASLAALRGLLGLEPDVPAGVVRIHPSLPPDHEITVRGLRLGDHEVSITVRGSEVVEADTDGLELITGPKAVLAGSEWGPA
jgi:glycogen debranching enzyme